MGWVVVFLSNVKSEGSVISGMIVLDATQHAMGYGVTKYKNPRPFASGDVDILSNRKPKAY